MSSQPSFEWTVLSSQTPSILRPCSRCAALRPFRSSGKFRLNANGGRLDAWLIYLCAQCSNRWNRTVFERRSVASLPPDLIGALQRNDPALAEQFARDRRLGGGKLAAPGQERYRLELTLVGTARNRSLPCGCPSFTIRNPSLLRVRLDQVLAKGLEVSRRDIRTLAKQGTLQVFNGSAKAFRQPLPAETVVICRRPGSLALERLLARLTA